MAKKNKVIKGGLEPTPPQFQFKAKLKQIKSAIRALEKQYHDKLKQCPHVIQYCYEIEKWSSGTTFKEGSTWCEVCDKDFGHYCDVSPDHACHYFTEDGMIKLNNGQIIDSKTLDPDHDPDWETDDTCLFCSNPQERK
jgi:hypothetical protein